MGGGDKGEEDLTLPLKNFSTSNSNQELALNQTVAAKANYSASALDRDIWDSFVIYRTFYVLKCSGIS